MIGIVVLLAVVIHGASSASCFTGWREYKDFCYGFSDEALTWFDAAASCYYYGARLVQVDSQAKHDWLVNEIVSKNFEYTWVGGTSKYHVGSWEWLPSHKSFGYSNWGSGEPNGPLVERCLEIRKPSGYKWNDRDCAASNYYICERQAA